MAKARFVAGLVALGVAVAVAGTFAALSANGQMPLPVSSASSPASAAPTATPGPTATPSPTATPGPTGTVPAVAPVTFGVVGDSITAWTGQEAGSWTSYVDETGVRFTGQGWAQNGAPLALMEANTPRVYADVLVILAGTNDLGGTLKVDVKLDLVDSIVERAGVDHVLISAVPPYDADPAKSTAWNRELREHAADEGYGFVDSWANARVSSGAFVPGHTVDGIHPTPGAAARAAAVISRAIVAADRVSD